jgi:hypothetical protein
MPLTAKLVEQRADSYKELALELFRTGLKHQGRFLPPGGRSRLCRGLRISEKAQHQVAEQLRDWHPFTISAALETVGKIGVQAKTDFSVHVHHVILPRIFR